MREIEIPAGPCQIFAGIEGEGPALVFLHGQLGVQAVVQPLVASLSGEWQVITPDVRGRGRSLCPHPEEHSWDSYADDVIAILDTLRVKVAVVGGVSLGAGIALKTALRHSERVRALVLHSNVYAGAETGWLEEQRRVQSQVLEAAEQVMSDAPEAGTILNSQKWARHDPKSLAAAIIGLGYSQPFGGQDDLASVAVPTMIVPGADPLHRRELSEMYRDSMPGASWVEPYLATFPQDLEDFLEGQFADGGDRRE